MDTTRLLVPLITLEIVRAARVYIAAAMSRRLDADDLAQLLRREGVVVVSTWHHRPGWLPREREHELAEHIRRDIAETCRRELSDATYVIALCSPDMRGALWECGYAAGRGLPVLWIGAPPTILASLDRVVDAEGGVAP